MELKAVEYWSDNKQKLTFLCLASYITPIRERVSNLFSLLSYSRKLDSWGHSLTKLCPPLWKTDLGSVYNYPYYNLTYTSWQLQVFPGIFSELQPQIEVMVQRLTRNKVLCWGNFSQVLGLPAQWSGADNEPLPSHCAELPWGVSGAHLPSPLLSKQADLKRSVD